MMGPAHAASGAAAWVGVAAVTPLSLGWLDAGPVPVLVGAAVASGAALLPDLDHHGSTLTRSLPPVTNALSWVVARVSGGHREGTHSFVGAIVATVLAWLASRWTIPAASLPENLRAALEGLPVDALPGGRVQAGAVLCAFVLVGMGLTTMKVAPGTTLAWVAALVGAVVVAVTPPAAAWWLPAAIAVGYVAHLLGDFLTTDGVNWLWPIKVRAPRDGIFWQRDGSLGLPILGDADSWRASTFGALCAAYSAAVACVLVVS